MVSQLDHDPNKNVCHMPSSPRAQHPITVAAKSSKQLVPDSQQRNRAVIVANSCVTFPENRCQSKPCYILSKIHGPLGSRRSYLANGFPNLLGEYYPNQKRCLLPMLWRQVPRHVWKYVGLSISDTCNLDPKAVMPIDAENPRPSFQK